MRGLIAAVAVGILCFSDGARADKQRVGDWILDIGRTYTEAFTSNNSGSTFGLFCGDGSCSFYLDTGTKCEENSKTPMLINADSGSTYVIALCIHIPGGGKIRYVNSIQDKDVVTAIATGNIIGFAFPLEGGEFKVVRFSLDGALNATQRAAANTKLQPKNRDTGLRDRTM